MIAKDKKISKVFRGYKDMKKQQENTKLAIQDKTEDVVQKS